MPSIAIKQETGDIYSTRCVGDCPQKLSGRCCHIGALLYLVEEMRLGLDLSYSKLPLIEANIGAKDARLQRILDQ